MRENEIQAKLKAIKYVQNPKTKSLARLVEEVESGCYCKPINSLQVVFWKNYNHVEVY